MNGGQMMQQQQAPLYGGRQEMGYGAAGQDGQAFAMDTDKNSPFFRGAPKKKVGGAQLAMGLFVPWFLFSVTLVTMSFKVHYDNKFMAYLIAFACGAVACGFVVLAALAVRKRGGEPLWPVFLGVTALLACVAGFGLGNVNYWENMLPFYDINVMNQYLEVDPATFKGQQLMDAGRINFKEGSKLDLTRSMGFKNLDYYCTAPITIGNDPLGTYDFWAVGKNCCSGNSADFHCGEFNNPAAREGLRLMNDEDRAFFRLAVQQAEASYNLKATHPIFVYWMQDPQAEIQAYEDDGAKYAILSCLGYFAMQLILCIIAALAVSKV